MRSVTDTSTVDLVRTKVALRDDLRFVPQRYAGNSWVHIEVTSTSAFYRVGFTEYVFLSLLDGQTTFAEALAVTARTQGAEALTEDRAMVLYRWVLDENLGEFLDVQVAEGRSSAGPKQEDAAKQAARWNPFWIRIPLGRPDGLLRSLTPYLGWLFSIPATIVGCALIVVATLRLLAAADRFEEASRQVFAPNNWLWLLVAWVLLKAIHETAHGLVCRRYGGSVRDSGIILAFFAPLAYVDVTSSWAFSSRWHRIHTALAGIYIELITASAAALIWLSTDSDLASHLLYNVIVMASVSTLLFNANPLMRFDGYYVLSDVLQIPNLASRSSEVMRHWLNQWFFGIKATVPTEVGSRRNVLLAYGLAAAAWKIVICASLLIAASVLFHGAGVAIALAGVIAWFGVPTFRFGRSLYRMANDTPARLMRGSLLAAATVAVAVGLFSLPVPFGSVAPGVVELPEGSAVRAETDGFVDTLHFSVGQTVQAGDLLLTLRNRELQTEYSDLVLQLRQARLRQRTAMEAHQPGDANVAADLALALEKRIAESLQPITGLEIRASVSGTVVLQDLDSLRGRYVREGDELLVIDNSEARELHISIAQEDLPSLRNRQGESIQVRIGTRPSFNGLLSRLTPRASLSLKYPELAAPEGGTLAVVAAEDHADYQLTEHRFDAVIQLPSDSSVSLNAGERGYAVTESSSRTMGVHVYRTVSSWLENQFAMAELSTL